MKALIAEKDEEITQLRKTLSSAGGLSNQEAEELNGELLKLREQAETSTEELRILSDEVTRLEDQHAADSAGMEELRDKLQSAEQYAVRIGRAEVHHPIN